MEQASLKDELRELILELRNYLETKYDIARLGVVETAAIISSLVLVALVIGALVLAAALFMSAALALYLGEKWGSTGSGFLVVGFGYVILSFVVFSMRKVLIKRPVLRTLITLILPKESDFQNSDEEEEDYVPYEK